MANRFIKQFYHLFSLFLLFTASCGNYEPADEKRAALPSPDSIQYAGTIKSKPHITLLWSKTDFVDDMESDNWEELVWLKDKPYTNLSIYENLLLITAYFSANGCAEYQGSIDISHDSLFLRIESKSKISCSELEFYKVTYVIDQPVHKKYIVVK